MRIHSWAIGLFLVLGIGFFTAILFLIGNRYDIFGKHVDFYAEFSDISGLPHLTRCCSNSDLFTGSTW